MHSGKGALGEWKSGWFVPIAGALGYATGVIHVYGFGVFIQPLQDAFGWSRSETTFGITVFSILSAICALPIGILIDRVGPRLIGIIGVIMMGGAFALLSTATGSWGNWMFLWVVIAIASLGVQATVWTSAVASRFAASRGLALAVCLSGASVAATIFPMIGNYMIEHFGWRGGFIGMAAVWIAIALPFIFFCFRGAKDLPDAQGETAQILPADGVVEAQDAAPTEPEGISLKQGLFSFTFLKLLIASGLFAFTIVAMVVHFVPILTNAGTSRADAASVAALIGIFSIVGRLGTGFLLDKLPSKYVGAVALHMPIIAWVVVLNASDVRSAQLLAAATFGLTLGSEIDVVVYLTTRHFGLKNFGGLYGGLLVALTLGTAFGPLAAAQVYDATNSYDNFLIATIGMMIVSSLALLSLPKPDFATDDRRADDPGDSAC